MAIEYLYCLLLNVPCLILLKLLVFFDVLSGVEDVLSKFNGCLLTDLLISLSFNVLLILHQDR
jgi:hypothetical protein